MSEVNNIYCYEVEPYEWKCGCKSDGKGNFQTCCLWHDNLISEALNKAQEIKE